MNVSTTPRKEHSGPEKDESAASTTTATEIQPAIYGEAESIAAPSHGDALSLLQASSQPLLSEVHDVNTLELDQRLQAAKASFRVLHPFSRNPMKLSQDVVPAQLEYEERKTQADEVRNDMAPTTPNNVAATKEALMAAIQHMRSLLTKPAVATSPRRVIDVVVQCLAVLPVETSAAITEMQKLRVALAVPVQNDMALPVTPADATSDGAASVEEALMAAIQHMRSLLTKSAVVTCPARVIDVVAQCLAALPTEASAAVAEIQKLHYALVNPVQNGMALPVTLAPPPTASDNGWTPLHIASQPGHCDAVTLLLAAGTGINRANNDGVRDASMKEVLVSAIQQMRSLLTKPAARTCPRRVIDVVVQCLAVLPVETSAAVAEMQKLRYALADLAPTTSDNVASTEETLAVAIQQFRSLLTKPAVATCPRRVIDVVVQCLAVLPVETSAAVAEMQKLRYTLADAVSGRKNDLQEINAVHERERLERATQIKDLAHQLELYADHNAAAKHLDLMHQRLNSIKKFDDATFQYISRPLGFDKRDYPFAKLTPGRLPDGTLVLRMQLQDQFGGDKDVLLRFKKTLALMQALDGGNGTLLRLIGGCNLDSNDPIAYVEHVTGLPLSEYLMVKQDATWSEKLWIASQVAKAMVHLHDLGCMHRDVSWSSVFVDATGDVKVFAGLKMRQVQLDKSYLTNGITEARWGAPETLAETDDNGATTYTDKIDIFGLGLVLISLVTCELPFTHVTSRGRAVPIDDNLVAARLSKRETAIPMLTQPFDDPNKCPSKEYEALAFACIRYDPERRPTAHEVVRRLEMIRQAYNGGLGCTTPNDIKVDVTITLVTTTVVPTSKVSASSYDMWCELKIDDCDRDPIQLERVTGSVTHAFNQYATLRDIEPLAHTVEVTLKSTATTTSTIGKISIPLMEFLKLAMNASALTTVGPTTYPIFKDGDIVGFLDIAVQFGGCLREYLEHFERRATEYLRNAEAGPSTLDLCKKRDLAAQALSSSVDIDKAMPRMDTTRVTTRSNVTDAVASLPLERQVKKTPNGPSVQDDMAPPVTRVTPHATPGGDASTEEASVAAIQPQRALTADKLPSRAVHPSLGHLPPKMMEMKLAVTCEWCNEENVPTASLCAHCGEEMPPVEERLELVHASYEGTAANKKLLEDYAALASQVETFEVELALLRRWTDVRGDLMADRDFEAAHQQLEAKYQKHFNALGEEKKKLQQERADVLTLQSTPYIDAKEVDFVDEQPLWRGDLFILHKVSLKNRVNNEVVTLVRKSLDPSAVEALRWNGALVTTLDKVKRSFANLRRLNGGHGSLIQILGASGLNDMSENPTIYMPYMPGGSLRNLLEKTPAAAALPWTTRLVMAFTIARGLYELHAIDHTHRDINSFHVLVDDEHRVVLTGFSQLRQPSLETMTRNVGDVRWAAPETMKREHARYSEKADIFSFGKVLEELATHALPYSSFRVGDKVISEHALEQRLANVTLDDPILQHNLDPSTPAYYAAIVEKCLVLEPSSRPTILTVLNSLRREVEKYLFPLQPPVTEPMHVQVEVQQAKGLHGTDPRPMEVQCNVSLGGDQSHTGFAAERGSSPTWNHRMDFRPQELVFMTLEARVYQKLDDELVQIGICAVPLQTMLPRQGKPTDSDWVVELEAPLFKDGNHCGELVLKVTFAGEGRLRWRDQYFDRLEYIDNSIKNERDPVRAATARVIRGMYAVDV